MEEKKYWKDVVINDNMPLSSVIEFLNILNNRLAIIEDVITTQDEEGNDLSLSEAYARKNEEGAK